MKQGYGGCPDLVLGDMKIISNELIFLFAMNKEFGQARSEEKSISDVGKKITKFLMLAGI